MKTIEEALEFNFQSPKGYDRIMLAPFLTAEQLPKVGVELNTENISPEDYTVEEFTEEKITDIVKKTIEGTVDHITEEKNPIAARVSVAVLLFGAWLLELEGMDEEVENAYDENNRLNYSKFNHGGLPLIKRIALAIGMESPIGDDEGTEDKYELPELSQMDEMLLAMGM